MNWKIRLATPSDQEAIREIYNEAVRLTTATFDTEPRSAQEQKKWFEAHTRYHPVLVAEDPSGALGGWASLSEYSPRKAYERTTENSVYVLSRFQKQGIGKRLLHASLEEGEKRGIHTVIARITTENEHSIRLHEEAGFVRVGVLKEVGVKFGRMLDVLVLQRLFSL